MEEGLLRARFRRRLTVMQTQHGEFCRCRFPRGLAADHASVEHGLVYIKAQETEGGRRCSMTVHVLDGFMGLLDHLRFDPKGTPNYRP